MRNKRGTDPGWTIIKYKGDIALYALCRCGFRYSASESEGKTKEGTWSLKQKISKLYSYCPSCGARKKYYSDIIIHVDQFPWE